MTPAGFIRRVWGVSTSNSWGHVYDLSYFFGFLVSETFRWLLHTAFQASNQTGVSPFITELHRTQPIKGRYAGSHRSHNVDFMVVEKEKVCWLEFAVFQECHSFRNSLFGLPTA